MRAQNDLMPTHSYGPYRSKNTPGTCGQPDFQQNFDNYNNSLKEPDVGGFLNPVANAPQKVKDAWAKADAQMGNIMSESSKGGMISCFSAYMLAKIEQRFQTGSSDVFGSSVDSSISGAQKILSRLNNPLSPPSSPEAAANRQREMLFYQKFINNLENSSGYPEHSETSPAALYAQMTGRAVRS